jgi:hypothetical protein
MYIWRYAKAMLIVSFRTNLKTAQEDCSGDRKTMLQSFLCSLFETHILMSNGKPSPTVLEGRVTPARRSSDDVTVILPANTTSAVTKFSNVRSRDTSTLSTQVQHHSNSETNLSFMSLDDFSKIHNSPTCALSQSIHSASPPNTVHATAFCAPTNVAYA